MLPAVLLLVPAGVGEAAMWADGSGSPLHVGYYSLVISQNHEQKLANKNQGSIGQRASICIDFAPVHSEDLPADLERPIAARHSTSNKVTERSMQVRRWHSRKLPDNVHITSDPEAVVLEVLLQICPFYEINT